MSPLRRASLNFFLPVGFILSPIRTGTFSPPICTVCVYDEMTVRSLGRTAAGFVFFRISVSDFMYSGVVPQHPPRITAPDSAISCIESAKSCGFTSKTVEPFSSCGRPAFGFTMTGVLDTAVRRRTVSFICSGPRLQFRPSASTPSPSRSAAIASGDAPVKRWPVVSYAFDTKIGKSALPVSSRTSFAAITAAFVS